MLIFLYIFFRFKFIFYSFTIITKNKYMSVSWSHKMFTRNFVTWKKFILRLSFQHFHKFDLTLRIHGFYVIQLFSFGVKYNNEMKQTFIYISKVFGTRGSCITIVFVFFIWGLPLVSQMRKLEKTSLRLYQFWWF